MGSFLKSGDRLHKGTGNIEWRHADVDIEHNLSEGGASGGVKSLEGNKHTTEVILAVLFLGEKVTVLPSSNCQGGGALLNDEIEGGNKRLEIPFSPGQVGIAISTQVRIGMMS